MECFRSHDGKVNPDLICVCRGYSNRDDVSSSGLHISNISPGLVVWLSPIVDSLMATKIQLLFMSCSASDTFLFTARSAGPVLMALMTTVYVNLDIIYDTHTAQYNQIKLNSLIQ